MNETLFGIWLLNLSLPVVLSLVTGLIYFWTRGRLNLGLGGKLQAFKYQKLLNSKYWEGSDTLFSWIGFDVVVTGIIFIILGSLYYKFSIMAFYVVGSLAAFIILPRYVGDIFNSLKYCFKTKDSLRLKELEEKVRELSKDK